MYAGVCRSKAYKGEKRAKFLARQTHISVNEKGLDTVDGLQAIPQLQVLYAFDNQIEQLEMHGGSFLTHLYLQRNRINGIGDLSSMKRLSKLYLDGNQILSLAPLVTLGNSLVELHLSSQLLPEGEVIDLDPDVLSSFHHLEVLSLANNGLTHVAPLAVIPSLTVIDLSRNLLEAEAVAPLVSATPRLRELDLRGNPVSSSRQAMDTIIVTCRSLEILSGRELTPHERTYLDNLHRRGARQLSLGVA